MSADQVLLGLGLTIALAVGSQILAGRLRIPPIIVLLPVGFVAGAATDVVDPDKIFGDAFPALVSLAVAVILYDAGLELDLRHLQGSIRRVVLRLIGFGVPITMGIAALTAYWLLDLSSGAALMLGAILVVSGPTVVGPLLDFVRPQERLQRILAWEGSLIDPVGGILGALLLQAVVSSSDRSADHELLQFLLSIAVGVAGGLAGVAVLWLILVRLRPGGVLDASAQLATVVAVAAVTDALRDDSGLLAAILMGLVVANRREFEVPARRPFLETLVQLILGLLFVSISATVTPQSLQGLVLPTLGLVAVLVVVARPLLAAVATMGSDLERRERVFVAWMDPRGIVAAATATSFSASLVAAGVGGGDEILPVTFLVIVATVGLYGLTALPVARRLGVVRSTRSRPLLVGGDPWVVDLAESLRSTGIEPVLWAPLERQREQIRAAGLELAPGRLLAAATGLGAELEGITMVLLLSDEDDFNALASTILEGSVGGQVYRLAPPSPSHGAVAPYLGTALLFGEDLAGAVLSRRHASGERVLTQPVDRALPAGSDLLFVVRKTGELLPVLVDEEPPAREPEDVAVLLGQPSTRAEESPGERAQVVARDDEP